MNGVSSFFDAMAPVFYKLWVYEREGGHLESHYNILILLSHYFGLQTAVDTFRRRWSCGIMAVLVTINVYNTSK